MKIILSKLSAHPLNRHFDRVGEKWLGMVGSVREHGVIQRPMVRPLGKGHQIVFGHRRVAAALEAGIKALECDVREIDDRTVLELLVIENLERENPDPVEEGKLLRALVAEGVDVTVLAHRLKRSVDWIVTRQRLLDLGDEVLEAVRKPKEAAGHLDMGTVRVILSVAEADRERAIQLVLHPEWATEVLGQREAESVIKSVILEPARKKAAWAKESPGLVRAYKKALGAFLTKEEKKDLIVQALRFEEWETCRLKTLAEDVIPYERLAFAVITEEGKRWVHLAIFHGLPVWVVPAEGTTDAEMAAAVVDERLIVMAETARAENGLPVTLFTGKSIGRKKSETGGNSNAESKEDEKREERIADALAELEGGGGEVVYQEEEEAAPEKVITQHMESRAWVDLGPVRRIRGQFAGLKWPDDEPPADAPPWVVEMWEGEGDMSAHIAAMCDWIEGLRK